MHHFFVKPEQIGREFISIQGSDVNHIRNVLRMKEGESFTVSGGEDGKFYRCELASFEPEQILGRILWVEEAGAELPCRITLFQCLPKADKMELIIQKAVELGAWEIVPVASKRSVVKLDAKKAQAKQKRWQAISESAAKQCKRLHVPKITPVCTWEEALARAGETDVRLFPYELAEDMEQTRRTVGAIRPGQSVAVFIGPEGGFAPEETESAVDAGCVPITLGKRILRTETAGMTVLSILMYCLEGREQG